MSLPLTKYMKQNSVFRKRAKFDQNMVKSAGSWYYSVWLIFW